MANFYIKDLSTTEEELKKIRDNFLKSEIEIEIIIPSYSKVWMCSKEELILKMQEVIGNQEEVNLICHSMGCNLGVILAKRIKRLNKVILVSPEFVPISELEKLDIALKYPGNLEDTKEEKLTLKKIKAIILFLRTRKWALEEITDFLTMNNTLIVYSKGDRYVSQKYIKELTNKSNITAVSIDSSYHNPLLNNKESIEKIKRYIKNP